jgi:hypothetical protein
MNRAKSADMVVRGWQVMRVVVALALLNGALTFANVWPSLAVRWRGEWSVEVAALVVLLAVWHTARGSLPRRALQCLSIGMVLLVLGRYADVTSPALYGRPINLYWDLPHASEVVAMLSRVASGGLLLGLILAVLCILALLYVLTRWSLGQIDDAMRAHRQVRVGLGAIGVLLVACFLAQQISPAVPRLPRFSIPVSKVYGLQMARIASVLSGEGARALPPSPVLKSNLSALGGDDLLLIFVESYGRTTYDRTEFAADLSPSRARLSEAIQSTGRSVVSAFVTSPTFAGTSVLAHLSLLSGVDVRDTRRYELLMTQRRPSLVTVFNQAGYRTIAWMPGNQHPWPEGSFYGFDHIFDAGQLGYRGPQFGWWHIPDQYSLAALDAKELQPQPHRPLFVFFPTLSTHMPFRPTPPVQPDWSRMLTSEPYDAAPLRAAMTRTPDWTHLGESYEGSVQYFFDIFASYLKAHPKARFTAILLGDHQPASSVSGEGASWDVPVHVISSRPEILQALRADGFQSGLNPTGPALGRMNQLTQWLLAAFNGAADAPVPDSAALKPSVPIVATKRRPVETTQSADRARSPLWLRRPAARRVALWQ